MLSTTSLGLARSQVEIPRFGSAQETNAVDPNIAFSEYNLSDNLDFPSTLEQYISHGPVCGARENSFMGDSNNTIGNIHQDKTINSTSPNLSDIYHLIHCLTLPPSMGERTYANTGYFSITSLGLLRSLVEIPVLLATNG